MAVYIEITRTGERLRLENPIWITRNRNGILTTPHRIHALGVGDGVNVWSLGKLEGYPEARLITLAQFGELESCPEPDPELSAGEALNMILGGSYESE